MVVEYGNYQYKHFKATVSEQQFFVGGAAEQRWRYFDSGPKGIPPLICLGAVAATSDVFYKQILTVGSKGYRVMAVDAPPIWTHEKWLTSFDQFLDALNINELHIYGTALGGFLGQLYTEHRPRRVLSLVLSNSFLETKIFNESYGTWTSLFPYSPDFVLKRLILSGFRDGAHEPMIADSIDFVVARMEKLSRSELGSRLALTCQRRRIGHLPLPPSKITLMDSLDYAAAPNPLRESLYTRYWNATQAFLKSGGDFPFLSRADEVNLHLMLHLRRVGAERVGPDIDSVPENPNGRWSGLRNKKQYLHFEDGEEEARSGGGEEGEREEGDGGWSVGRRGGEGSRGCSLSALEEDMSVHLLPRARSYPDALLLGTQEGEGPENSERRASSKDYTRTERNLSAVVSDELPVSDLGPGHGFADSGVQEPGTERRLSPGIGFWTLNAEESEEGWGRTHSDGLEEGVGGKRVGVKWVPGAREWLKEVEGDI